MFEKNNVCVSGCQLYLDVDCSKITYDTPPSPTVLAAVNSTLEKIEQLNSTTTVDNNSTATDLNSTATDLNSTTTDANSTTTDANSPATDLNSTESVTTTNTNSTLKSINETLSTSLLSSIGN